MHKKLKLGMLLVVITILLFSCKQDENEDETPRNTKQFGLVGKHNVATFTAANYAYTTIYYPSDIANMQKKTPLIFFISGWYGASATSETYLSLLQFMASHGYTVIYTDEGATTNPQHAIDAFENMLSNNETTFTNQILPYIDTSRIGVMGHSAGGGTTFTTLKYYSNAPKNYGTNARFIMAFDPWYAFGMTENDIKTLPNNTNVVIEKFGVGGNNSADGTDARIPLTEYALLESIPDSKKDYMIYDKENADHTYPKGNRAYTEMQGILKPLDALLDYTFVEQSEATRIVALENGNDHPYTSGKQVVLAEYQYPCDGAANTLIDYCAIVE